MNDHDSNVVVKEQDLSDEELFASFVKGREAAYQEIHDRHFESITTFHRRYVPPDVAEDLAVETFLKILQSPHAFDLTRGRFKAWLYRIAFNVRNDYWRSTNRMRLAIDPDVDQEELLRQFYCPGKASLEEILFVRHELGKLPPLLREPLELKWLDGLSTREIAEVFQIPEGTVSSRLHAGLEILKSVAGFSHKRAKGELADAPVLQKGESRC